MLISVKRHRRPRQPRPVSPYSTDSNFSAVVHKPYPKSQRKKQLVEQGKTCPNCSMSSHLSRFTNIFIMVFLNSSHFFVFFLIFSLLCLCSLCKSLSLFDLLFLVAPLVSSNFYYKVNKYSI